MVEFMKKMTDWMLQKEQEAASQCHIDSSEVQKQIEEVQRKKLQMQRKYEDQMKEFDHVLSRLTFIKASADSCKRR
jgi:hypothetical protein